MEINEFEKLSWLSQFCMGDIMFIDHSQHTVSYEEIEEELDYFNMHIVGNLYKEDGHMAWKIAHNAKELSGYSIDDGYAIVGVGWTCPYCEKNHSFEDVFTNELYECSSCKEISISKITTQDWW